MIVCPLSANHMLVKFGIMRRGRHIHLIACVSRQAHVSEMLVTVCAAGHVLSRIAYNTSGSSVIAKAIVSSRSPAGIASNCVRSAVINCCGGILLHCLWLLHFLGIALESEFPCLCGTKATADGNSCGIAARVAARLVRATKVAILPSGW
jgi:hypothetical protein